MDIWTEGAQVARWIPLGFNPWVNLTTLFYDTLGIECESEDR